MEQLRYWTKEEIDIKVNKVPKVITSRPETTCDLSFIKSIKFMYKEPSMEPVKRIAVGMKVQFFMNEDDENPTEGIIQKYNPKKKKARVQVADSVYDLERGDLFKVDDKPEATEPKNEDDTAVDPGEDDTAVDPGEDDTAVDPGEDDTEETDDNEIKLKFRKITDYESTTTSKGNKSKDTADVVAQKLRKMPMEEVFEFVSSTLKGAGVTEIGSGKKKGGVEIDDLTGRYSDLNLGMQRMNLGNVLRGAMKKHEFSL